MFLVMALDPANECALPIGRSPAIARVDPALEIAMQGLEIPTWADFTQIVDGLVGHVAAGPRGRQTGNRRPDQGLCVERFASVRAGGRPFPLEAFSGAAGRHVMFP